MFGKTKTIKGYKGFLPGLICRDFKFEVGKTFEHKGKVEACESGFHFCEDPFDIFNYYDPANSVFAEVEGSGKIDKHNEDTKVACSKLKIKAEISLNKLIDAGVKFILEKVDFKNAKESNDEDQSAATNTGDQSAATNTGYRSAATNTGYRSAASVDGKESVAMAIGYESKAKGKKGCWLVLAEWEYINGDGYHIKDVQSVKIDGKNIKANTWYTLKNGKFEEYDN